MTPTGAQSVMHDAPTSTPAPASGTADQAVKKRKKRSRMRHTWISFTGRIVAQIIGAVASVTLAIVFLQQGRSDEARAGAPPASEPLVRPRARPSDGRTTLAVLPLANFSGDPRQDSFADGMTEAIIADLAQIEGLRVMSRTSVMRYRGVQKTVPELARELGVDVIVEGSVVRDGDRVRVTVQLVDAATDAHVWARSYDRTLRDVLTLQGQLAAEIAGEVKTAISPPRQRRLTARRPIDPLAHDLYLRRRQAWNLRSDAGFKAAVAYVEQAIARDPQFAPAYGGLADAHVLANLTGAGDTSSAQEQARAAR
jgi:TolB-like protein